jgi:hypothetical protein
MKDGFRRLHVVAVKFGISDNTWKSHLIKNPNGIAHIKATADAGRNMGPKIAAQYVKTLVLYLADPKNRTECKKILTTINTDRLRAILPTSNDDEITYSIFIDKLFELAIDKSRLSDKAEILWENVINGDYIDEYWFDIVFGQQVEEALDTVFVTLQRALVEVRGKAGFEWSKGPLEEDRFSRVKNKKFVLLRADQKNGRYINYGTTCDPNQDEWYESLGIQAVPVEIRSHKDSLYWIDYFTSEKRSEKYLSQSIGSIQQISGSEKLIVTGFDLNGSSRTFFTGVFDNPIVANGAPGVMFSFQLHGSEMESYRCWIVEDSQSHLNDVLRHDNIRLSLERDIKKKRGITIDTDSYKFRFGDYYFPLSKLIYNNDDCDLNDSALDIASYIFPPLKKSSGYSNNDIEVGVYERAKAHEIRDPGFRRNLNYEFIETTFISSLIKQGEYDVKR